MYQVLGNLGLVRSAWASRLAGPAEVGAASRRRARRRVQSISSFCRAAGADNRPSLAFALECRDPPGRRALRCSNQKSKNSGCLFLRPLLALNRLFSALHCSREGRLVRLSLAIERAFCLVVPSQAKNVGQWGQTEFQVNLKLGLTPCTETPCTDEGHPTRLTGPKKVLPKSDSTPRAGFETDTGSPEVRI